MCMLPGLSRDEDVSGTRILAVPYVTENGERRQATVYANQLHTQQRPLMVYAVPTKTTDASDISVSDLSLEHHPTLFTDLDACFTVVYKKSMPQSNASVSYTNSEPMLAVQRQGRYKVSIAPNAQAIFSRVDRDLLEPELATRFAQFLANSYPPTGFAFVIAVFEPPPLRPTDYAFGLRNGPLVYSEFPPLGITHPSPSDNTVFYPTMHYHGPDSAAALSTPHWDHTLYMMTPRPQLDTPWLVADPAMVASRASKLPSFLQRLLVGTGARLSRVTISGQHPNQDTIISLQNTLPQLHQQQGGADSCALC